MKNRLATAERQLDPTSPHPTSVSKIELRLSLSETLEAYCYYQLLFLLPNLLLRPSSTVAPTTHTHTHTHPLLPFLVTNPPTDFYGTNGIRKEGAPGFQLLLHPKTIKDQRPRDTKNLLTF